jgi:hypothetical protein
MMTISRKQIPVHTCFYFKARQGKARQGKANIFNVLIMHKENLFVGDNIIKNK